MTKPYEIRLELIEKVKSLDALVKRREAQGCAFPIIEAARKELNEAAEQLVAFDKRNGGRF